MAFNNFGSWWRSLGRRINQPAYDRFIPINFSSGATAQRITDNQAVEMGYMTNQHIYPIISKIARDASTLPYRLVEVQNDGSWEYVYDGELHDLIFENNNECNFTELLSQSLIYYNVTGELYVLGEIESIGFLPNKLEALPPQLMEVILDKPSSIRSTVTGYRLMDNINEVFSPDEILHLRAFSPDSQNLRDKNGLSPLNSAYNILNASNNNAVAAGEAFENRGISAIVSGNPGTSGLNQTPDDIENLEKAAKQNMGGAHRANSLYFTPKPVSVNQLAMSNSDLQLMEMDIQHLRILCNHYGMPSELFNDPDNKIHANRREAIKTLYNEVLIPNAEMFTEGINRKWVRQVNQREGRNYKLVIDKEEIKALHPDSLEQKRIYLEEFKSGAISRELYLSLTGKEDDGQQFAKDTGMITNNQQQ
jgi:HK97 family phage portal protein